jgi:hypothetical protein
MYSVVSMKELKRIYYLMYSLEVDCYVINQISRQVGCLFMLSLP